MEGHSTPMPGKQPQGARNDPIRKNGAAGQDPRTLLPIARSHEFLRRHEYGRSPEPSEIWATDAQNALRCRQAIEDIETRERQPRSQHPVSPTTLLDSLPAPISKLHCKVMQRIQKNVQTGWLFVIAKEAEQIPAANHAANVKFVDGRQTFAVLHNLIPQDTPMQRLQLVCDRLRNICERISFFDSMSIYDRRNISREATAMCLGLHDSALQDRVDAPKKVNIGIQFNVSCLDMGTFANQRVQMQLIKSITIPFMDSQNPMLAKISQDFAIKHPFSWFEAELAKYTDMSERETFRLACWIQDTLHHRYMMSPTSVRNWVALVQELVGAKYEDDAGILPELCDAFEQSDCYRIKLSEIAQADIITGSLPDILVVKDLHALRRVLESMFSIWYTSADLEAAWQRGCIRADLEYTLQQENGACPPRICYCLPDQRSTSVHLCDACGNSTLCYHLVNGKCPSCLKVVEDVGEQQPEQTADGAQEAGATSGDADENATKKFTGRVKKPGKLSYKKERTKRTGVGKDPRWHLEDLFRHDSRRRTFETSAARNVHYQSLKKQMDNIYDRIKKKFNINESRKTFYDAYAAMEREMYHDEHRHPFAMTYDAAKPLTAIDGDTVLHHVENIVVTSYYLNSLKHTFFMLLIRLVIALCRTSDPDEQAAILRRVDHVYLIRAQIPYSNRLRLAIEPDSDLLRAFEKQMGSGFANKGDCVASGAQFWSVLGGHKRSRYDTKFPGQRDPRNEFPDQAKIERILESIDQRCVSESRPMIPRISGVPYPYDIGSAPLRWRWTDLIRIFSLHLNVLTAECNRHYHTTCTISRLFLTQCMQYAFDETAMRWLRTSLAPFNRHPFKPSAAHANHAMDMTDGWVDEYESIDDFNWTECNVCFEPVVYNYMRGNLDHYLDQMEEELRTTIPLDNPPYWPGVLPQMRDLPDLSAPGLLPKSGTKRTKAKQRNKKQKRRTAGKEKQGEGTGSLTPPYPNLSNNGNTCYASSILQCFRHIPQLHDNVFADFYYPMQRRKNDGSFAETGGYDDHRSFINSLKQVIDIMKSTAGPKLHGPYVGSIVEEIRKHDQQFKLGEEGDPAVFFDRICTILNEAGDRSWLSSFERLEKGEPDPKTPLQLSGEEKNAVKEGFWINSLRDDQKRNLDGHMSIGNDSLLTQVLGFQAANESYCTQDGCPSPYSRSWLHGENMVLEFSEDQRQSSTTICQLPDLIDDWTVTTTDETAGEGSKCEYNETHPRKNVSVRKLTHLPPVLALRLQRLSMRGLYGGESLTRLENTADFAMNPLAYDEDLDLSSAVRRLLPSEEGGGIEAMPTQNINAKYKLKAVVQYRNGHYVSYIKVNDAQTNRLRWAIFNDLEPVARWESPFEVETQGRTGEFLLLFSQSTGADDFADPTADTTVGGTARDAMEIDSEESDSGEDVSDDDDADYNPYPGEEPPGRRIGQLRGDGLFVGEGSTSDDSDSESESTDTNMEDVFNPDAIAVTICGMLEEVALNLEGNAANQVHEVCTQIMELAQNATTAISKHDAAAKEVDMLKAQNESLAVGATSTLQPDLQSFEDQKQELQGEVASLTTARMEAEAELNQLLVAKSEAEEQLEKVRAENAGAQGESAEPLKDVYQCLDRLSLSDILKVQQAITDNLPDLIKREMNAVGVKMLEKEQEMDERERMLQLKAEEVRSQQEALSAAQQAAQGLTPGQTGAGAATLSLPPSRIPRPVSRETEASKTPTGPSGLATPAPKPPAGPSELATPTPKPPAGTAETVADVSTPRGRGGTARRGDGSMRGRGGSMRGRGAV